MLSLDFARGRVAERSRIAAIVLAPAAHGRIEAAVELALNSSLSVEDAHRLLVSTADAKDLAPPRKLAGTGMN